jgi:hypothetical protein
MNKYTLLIPFKRMVPALLGVAVLVLAASIPPAGAVEGDPVIKRSPAQMDRLPMQEQGFRPQWYDPRAWFERGGSLEHQSDWYDYTFAYGRPGARGYLGAHGEPPPFGYFGERSLDEDGLLYGRDIELNYYTNDWYNREGTLEGWL